MNLKELKFRQVLQKEHWNLKESKVKNKSYQYVSLKDVSFVLVFPPIIMRFCAQGPLTQACLPRLSTRENMVIGGSLYPPPAGLRLELWKPRQRTWKLCEPPEHQLKLLSYGHSYVIALQRLQSCQGHFLLLSSLCVAQSGTKAKRNSITKS